eukprot:TRINITY_DN21997_c0_g1_i1.p1 TRINITY_DN21997_c0_g1~~TRINITY_DN21997_c0_g1_i1.p1  ORF type:complete len:401 (+),score=64.43 TRINITY_DN21997_c0_g1_i1:245-1447(+)
MKVDRPLVGTFITSVNEMIEQYDTELCFRPERTKIAPIGLLSVGEIPGIEDVSNETYSYTAVISTETAKLYSISVMDMHRIFVDRPSIRRLFKNNGNLKRDWNDHMVKNYNKIQAEAKAQRPLTERAEESCRHKKLIEFVAKKEKVFERLRKSAKSLEGGIGTFFQPESVGRIKQRAKMLTVRQIEPQTVREGPQEPDAKLLITRPLSHMRNSSMMRHNEQMKLKRSREDGGSKQQEQTASQFQLRITRFEDVQPWTPGRPASVGSYPTTAKTTVRSAKERKGETPGFSTKRTMPTSRPTSCIVSPLSMPFTEIGFGEIQRKISIPQMMHSLTMQRQRTPLISRKSSAVLEELIEGFARTSISQKSLKEVTTPTKAVNIHVQMKRARVNSDSAKPSKTQK